MFFPVLWASLRASLTADWGWLCSHCRMAGAHRQQEGLHPSRPGKRGQKSSFVVCAVPQLLLLALLEST